MELGIQINGEFLDLQPNTVLELEEENPFLQLGNEVQGQYSLPLTVPITDKNMRLLRYPNLFNIKKSNAGIDAVCFTNGIQHSRGQVKLESGQSNLNMSSRGFISIYYLFGLADFYKNVENIFLTDVELGGDVVLTKGNFDANGDGTFWDYIKAVMANGTQQQYNFSFFPVVNEGGLTYSDSTNTVLNCISYYNNKLWAARWTHDNDTRNLLGHAYNNEICPFPYVVFVIKKVFEHIGWTVQGDILNDPDFLSVVILYNKPIDWLSAYAHNTDIVWNLKNHVPKIKVGSFLLGLANRFGWWFDFDYRKRIATIKSRKSVFSSRNRKDFTAKAGASYSFKVNTNDKVYGLLQSGGPGEKPDFTQLNFKGVLNNSYSLPTANSSTYYNLYFLVGENAYYICLQDENNNYTWEKSTDNTFDYTPTDQSDEISTCCLVPGTVAAPLFEIFYTQPYLGNFHYTSRNLCLPSMNIIPGEQETETFYICYQYGLQPTMNNGNLNNYVTPSGGTGCHNLQGDLIRQTALVYEYKGGDNIERGLFATQWEYFLNFMQQREEVTIPIKLNLIDLLNLDYTDTILIRNTEFFIKNPHFSLPLKDFANMELVRV